MPRAYFFKAATFRDGDILTGFMATFLAGADVVAETFLVLVRTGAALASFRLDPASAVGFTRLIILAAF